MEQTCSEQDILTSNRFTAVAFQILSLAFRCHSHSADESIIAVEDRADDGKQGGADENKLVPPASEEKCMNAGGHAQRVADCAPAGRIPEAQVAHPSGWLRIVKLLICDARVWESGDCGLRDAESRSWMGDISGNCWVWSGRRCFVVQGCGESWILGGATFERMRALPCHRAPSFDMRECPGTASRARKSCEIAGGGIS